MSDPCKSHTKIKFLPKVPAKRLQSALNKLCREGYDVEVALDKEAVEEYEEETYTILATKDVCVCSDRAKDLEAKVDELELVNEEKTRELKEALRKFGDLKRSIIEMESSE